MIENDMFLLNLEWTRVNKNISDAVEILRKQAKL